MKRNYTTVHTSILKSASSSLPLLVYGFCPGLGPPYFASTNVP